MKFEFEVYKDVYTGNNMVVISSYDGCTVAEYPYKTESDIGKAIAKFLKTYYHFNITNITN